MDNSNTSTKTSTKLKKCGNCKAVYYCSPACQKEDWSSHKPDCDAKKEEVVVDDECPICLETIHKTNNRTTTECGHCFHASCLVKHSVLTNLGCPMCRSQLADIPEEEDDEDSYATTVSDETDETDETDEAPLLVSQRRNITQVLAEMKRRNITERQLVAALISITYQEQWRERFFILNEADDAESQILDVMDNITTMAVDHRDTRRYSDVLNNVVAVSEAGIGPTISN